MPRQGRVLRHLLTAEECTITISATRAFIHRISGYEITDDTLVREIDDHQSKGCAATTLLGRMTSNRALAARGLAMGIEGLIVQAPGVEESASEERVATVVEAVLGAIWLHSGHDEAVIEAAVKKMKLHRPSRRGEGSLQREP